jgi:nicotinamide riboside transporter PnuC
MIGQVISAILGVWLMFAPAVFGHVQSTLHDIDRGIGPTIGAISAVAATRICRSIRWLNWLFAPVLVIGPWFVDAPTAAKINTTVVGLAIIALTPWGRPDQSRYGNGWLTLVSQRELPGWDAPRGGEQTH